MRNPVSPSLWDSSVQIMTSADDSTSIAATSFRPRPRKSVADRLTSLFTSKGGNLGDYYIELDDPLKFYGPGDTVRGKVVLDVARPLGVTHIVVCLFGYVEVFKNHKPRFNPRNNNPRAVSGRGKRWVTEYYGDGFATLFEDDTIICGEGRLDPKLYHFNFEIEFPTNMTLPSSIDFERGTISYVLSSTITRPTTIAPTTSCDRKVKYQETVDVGSFTTPKPRVITLEPVETGGKRRAGIKRLASYNHETSTTSRTSTQSTTAAAAAATASSKNTRSNASPDDNRSSHATSPSLRSSTSAAGSTTARESRHKSEIRSPRTSHSPRTDTDSRSTQTIEVTVAMDRAASLPGDIVPLKVTVHHTKAIRSLYGVIVTLYRQARTDLHPNLPLRSSNEKDKSKKYEDYYPRSRTGLGGLSLSAAGSSQVWRKDLSQTFAPLYVNPQTMSTEVKAMVRVPDDAFPSIKNAPGGMISFNYFVEVLVDIHGKLAQGTSFPSLNLTGGLPNIPNGPLTSASDDGRDQSVTAWGLNCIDTSQILRERTAVSCLCDLVIGTKDTAKARGKRRQEGAPLENGTVHLNGDHHSPWHGGGHAGEEFNEGYDNFHDGYDYYLYDYDAYNGQHYYRNYPRGYVDGNTNNPASMPVSGHDSQTIRDLNNNTSTNDHPRQPPPVILPPRMPDEENMTEKERIRRAEQQLLPSRPPDMGGELSTSEASPHNNIPTAPVLPDENAFDTPSSYQAAVARQYAAPPSQRHESSSPFSAEADPRLPAYEPRGAQASPGVSPNGQVAEQTELADVTEDKQELERRRLQAMASSPETDTHVQESHTSRPSAPPVYSTPSSDICAPSAPVVDELGHPASGLSGQRHDSSQNMVEDIGRISSGVKEDDDGVRKAEIEGETRPLDNSAASNLPALEGEDDKGRQEENYEFNEVLESSEGEEEGGKAKREGL